MTRVWLLVRRARPVQLDVAVMGVWGIGVSSLPWQAARLSGLLGTSSVPAAIVTDQAAGVTICGPPLSKSWMAVVDSWN